MSSSLNSSDAFVLRQTNVSNPSVVHSRPSQQSISASEDYYSLSASSNSSVRSGEAAGNPGSTSQQTITRYQTPPSRYRTPHHSRELLPLFQQAQHVSVGQPEEDHQDIRKTPMRGHGKRRSSAGEGSIVGTTAAGAAEPLLTGSATQTRDTQSRGSVVTAIRRKPVPSAGMEQRESYISPMQAQSSVARDFNRQDDAPTPGVDDTPYIQFALDQLTRDEEVRGSRMYPGIAPGIDGAYPYQANVQFLQSPQPHYESVPQEERDIVEQPPYTAPSPPPVPILGQALEQSLRNSSPSAQKEANVFVSVPAHNLMQPLLNFLPGILRPLQLGLYIVLVFAYSACLIVAAVWSRAERGLWRYASFGDARYFVFQYLPTLLGMVLLMWLFEIEKAVYRVAPFISIASDSTASRIMGPHLPLQPRSFVLPYFGHFRARQPVIGGFLFVAWLQIFGIPLLGSSFNVYQDGIGEWTWLATQGVIWTAIALYSLLAVALIALLVWLARQNTGLKWDPKSLADIAVLLERSNALGGLSDGVPQLGHFHTIQRPNEIFHTFGIAGKPARHYETVDGQLRESKYSDGPGEYGALQPPRRSREAILPHSGTDDFVENHGRGNALPWFLRPSLALLWPIIAIVLLLAFLIVSYLPSTSVLNGFDPMVPAEVNTMGFSSTNLLYSFIPTLLAMLCLLFWMDIDLAHRRLAPFESLIQAGPADAVMSEKNPDETDDTIVGDIPERTLLTSYTADYPLLVSLSAISNSHAQVAFLSAMSLLSASLPILASGVFWAEFYIPDQRVLIFAHTAAYYVLSVFVTIYALAYLVVFPSSNLRNSTLVPGNVDTFAGIQTLFRQSRLLDNVAVHSPSSKIDLVTRLLSTSPAGLTPNRLAAASKVSLADSVRGFGRARGAANNSGDHWTWDNPRYALTHHQGRDGTEHIGIDRMQSER